MQKLRANDFEIGFPHGWTDNSTVTMIGPPRPGFSPNVQVNREPVPAESTVEAYFAEQRAELHSLESFRMLEVGDRLLGGQRAEYHLYDWRIPQGIDIRQLQLATGRGGTLYTVTCSATIGDWEHFEPAFEMVIAGFRFAG